ncbi:MAG: SDR family oxidoreductase, partial [Rhizobiales bacterium]|nr:SDR family oxidoreductase [Hyphomicrobiales bacterium]
MRLKGKTALVTGATSGIGAATARMFLDEGANVLIADIERDGAEAIIARSANPAAVKWIHLDVTREAEWLEAVKAAGAAFGHLDILVNSAGRSSRSGEPLGTVDWQRIMEVNATGVFLGIKHAVPAMEGGGSIVNIASIMALVGSEGGHPAYHASKGAVRALTRTSAVRYGPLGIRVNAIFPGFLPTMRTGTPIPPDALERFID